MPTEVAARLVCSNEAQQFSFRKSFRYQINFERQLMSELEDIKIFHPIHRCLLRLNQLAIRFFLSRPLVLVFP
jgi:hypothetical protein